MTITRQAPHSAATAPRLLVQTVVANDGWGEVADAETMVMRAVEAAWAYCWQRDWPELTARARLERFGSTAFEMAIELCDDERIRQLNVEFRGKDKPTNVLSFPSGDLCHPPPAPMAGAGIYLGDVAMALQTVQSEARQKRIPVVNHVAHLTIHAMLHLLGWDHIDEKAAENMEALEIEILRSINIANPY